MPGRPQPSCAVPVVAVSDGNDRKSAQRRKEARFNRSTQESPLRQSRLTGKDALKSMIEIEVEDDTNYVLFGIHPRTSYRREEREMTRINWTLRMAILKWFDTQMDFALMLREHPSKVSNVIRGRRELTWAEKQRWAAILKSDPLELFASQR